MTLGGPADWSPRARWYYQHSRLRWLARDDAYVERPYLTGEIGRYEGMRFIKAPRPLADSPRNAPNSRK